MEKLIPFSPAINAMYNGNMKAITRTLTEMEQKCVDWTFYFETEQTLPDMSALTEKEVIEWIQFCDQYDFKECWKNLCLYQMTYYRSLFQESRTLVILFVFNTRVAYAHSTADAYTYLIPSPEYINMFKLFVKSSLLVEHYINISHFNKWFPEHHSNQLAFTFFNENGGKGKIFKVHKGKHDFEDVFKLKRVDTDDRDDIVVITNESLIQYCGELDYFSTDSIINTLGYHIDEIHHIHMTDHEYLNGNDN